MQRIFTRISPNLPERVVVRLLPTNFRSQRSGRPFLVWPLRKVFVYFNGMPGPVVWSQTTLGAISAWSCRDFARIFGDFVQVFRDFARIFDKAKTLGVRLHPLLLHHCLQLSYFLTWRKIRNLIFVKQHRIALASCEILQFVRKTDICFYYFLLLLFVQNVEIRSKSVVKASYAINLHRSKESRIFTYLLLHLWED